MKRIIKETIRNSIINTAVLLTLMLGIENILYEYYYRIHIISYISKYFYFFSSETLVPLCVKIVVVERNIVYYTV
ncbi:hypothetical protein, partial [uncultured Clostridium sp.]|uniref:hypothetical protein n=1 Tax=uncultured Clostridium sp. TaxID=59620 RepID=UPI002616FDB6